MNKYYDYFPEQENISNEVTMDEFIAEAMRTDLQFKTLAAEPISEDLKNHPYE